MRLLVTGVSGLLGVNLAVMAAGPYDVIGVMRGERAALVDGRAPFEVITADLTLNGQVERVLDLARPDVIIHCAALTQVDSCEQAPEQAWRINTWLPGVLAAAAAQRGVQLLHISTDAVFDGLRGEYTEEDTPHPINVYARTKLEGEQAVAAANPNAIIARVNFFGWSWQGHRSLAEFFYHNLAAGRPVTGFADVIFCPLLVNDMVEVLLRMLDRRLHGLYHVVSAESLSKYEFARLLARQFGFDERLISPASYRSAGLKAPRSPRLTLRSDKLSAALGETMPDMAGAMCRFYELYRQDYPRSLRELFDVPDHSASG